MKIHQIGGIGSDSNIYLIIDETIALIDAGTGQNFDVVKKNLSKLGLKPSDVELVIDTHCHFDHAGGNADFVSSGSELAIHELEAGFLRKGDQLVTLAGLFGRKLEPIEVNRELHNGERITLGKLVLEVINTPGHTRGSICLHEPNHGILFSGDTVFCGDVGRTDLPTSDEKALTLSLRKLADLKVERLYPGHGPSAEKNAHEQIMIAIEVVGESGQLFK